jgi:hypothetical protein
MPKIIKNADGEWIEETQSNGVVVSFLVKPSAKFVSKNTTILTSRDMGKEIDEIKKELNILKTKLKIKP